MNDGVGTFAPASLKTYAGTSFEQIRSTSFIAPIDVNKDGRHSRKEYVDGGRHLTPEARAGIFQASDTDRDGFVSEKEYVENRVITDQAKELFVSIDSDGDGRLTGGEIVGSRKVENAKLALVIFSALDTNGDEMLHLPEFLYTWGRWARARKETKDRR